MNHAAVMASAQESGNSPGVACCGPDCRGFIALLKAFRATGGTAPGEIAGRLLEEHGVCGMAGLADLVSTGEVFGFEWRSCLWIPLFQFDMNDFTRKAGPRQVRAELPLLWSGWTIASWFAAPNVQLESRSPADLLDSDFEAVMHAARWRESGDGFALPVVRWPAGPGVVSAHA